MRNLSTIDAGQPGNRWVRSSGVGANHARTALLLGGLTALVVLISGALGGTGWAVGALVVMAAMNLAGWWWSDRIVIAMHRAQPLPIEEAPEVHAMVARLAGRAGIPKPRIYWVPDRAPNAFATGRGPNHAVIAVTAGLLDLLDRDELEGVLAHELSHVLNRDVLISTVAATLAGTVSLLARLAGWTALLGGQRRDDDGPSPLAALVLMIVAPLIALIVQLAVSRSREFGADATGARLAGSPLGLASALDKLHRVSRRVPMRSADPATAHMYIMAPLSGRTRALEWFSTHPPVEERVRRLRAMVR